MKARTPKPACHGRGLRGLRAPLLAAMVAGCADSDERPGAPVVIERDSAGVRVVAVSDIYRDLLPEWGIEGPHLIIGEVAGSPEYNLFNVVGAAVLGDGRIAVANAGTAEVRVFDASGRHDRTIGREGDGPGEFARLSWLGRLDGDTLVTFDSGPRRASWFTHEGELIQTLRIDPWGEEPANRTRFGIMTVEPLAATPGRLLLRAGYERRGAEGEYRDTFSLALLDRRGALETLGSYPGAELYYARSDGGAFATMPPILGRDTYVTGSGSRIVVGSSDRFELSVYDAASSGTAASLRMKVLATVDLPPLTDAEVESWRQEFRERARDVSGEFGEAARMAIENAPARRTPPAFRQLVVDSGHSIWVARTQTLPGGVSSWIVLAADGTPEAKVDLPPDVEILEIGGDYVLCLRRDDAGVEQVVMYGLRRIRSG